MIVFLAGLHVLLPFQSKTVGPAIGMVKGFLMSTSHSDVFSWGTKVEDKFEEWQNKTTGSFAVLLCAVACENGTHVDAELYV